MVGRPLNGRPLGGRTLSARQLGRRNVIATPTEGVGATPTTWSETDKTDQFVLSNGNLTGTANTDGAGGRSNTSHSTGKVYFEFSMADYVSGDIYCGVANASAILTDGDYSDYPGASVDDICAIYGGSNSVFFNNASAIAVAALNLTNGRICSFAIDIDAGLFWVRVNGGIWNNSPTANPATSAEGADISVLTGNGPIFIYTRNWTYAAAAPSWTIAPGPSGLTYAIPTGYLAWGDPRLPLA